MRTRMQKLRVALLAAVTMGAAVLFYSASPARADVDAVAGSAFGASITSTLLGTVLAPSPPGISGSATEPVDGFGPIGASNCPLPVGTTICVQVPGVLSIGAVNASTQGGGVAGENHLGFATSSASVADVAVGVVGQGLFAQAVSSTCTADGNGARGSTQVTGGVLGGNPVLQAPAVGTALGIPGILEIVLNEQLPIPPATSINSVGNAGIIVNGARITLLPTLGGLTGTLSIILAQSVCAAAGPDVNVVQTTSSTVPPTSSSTVPPTSSSTVPPTSSSTVPPSSSSTVPPTSSSTVPPPTTAVPGTNINVCNAGDGGNGGTGIGTGGSALSLGGTATAGSGAGIGGAGGSGGNACNGLTGIGGIGTGFVPVPIFGIPSGGPVNVNICNAGDGGNGGAGLGSGGSAASIGTGNATGGSGAGIGGTAGDGGDACNITLTAATTSTTTGSGGGGGGGGAGGAGGGGGAGGAGGAGGGGGAGGAGGAGGSGGGGGAGGTGGAGVAGVGLLARTGAHMGPVVMMALVLTVLGMLMFFGSQGLPDPSARAFASHPMFRPIYTGRPSVLPAGASGRLDATALDALIGMESPTEPVAYEAPPEGSGRGGWSRRRWLSQRPW